MSFDLSSLFPFRIEVTAEMIGTLRELRAVGKFSDLPGSNTEDERVRCTAKVDELLDRIIAGLHQNPRKTWVFEQFVPTLRSASTEDTEARERFGPYLAGVMDAVGIESSSGLLDYYLAFGGDIGDHEFEQ
jgi:hypothetical protein